MGDQLLLGKLSSTGTKLARMDQLYRFEVRGPERVAGRNATVLLAIPLDPYRYSYFLSIDNETGLVLKSWLVDDAGRPMERYQFVDLSLNPNISEVRVQPEAHLHRDATADTGDCDQTELSQPVKWQLEWIPPGFAFVGQKVVKEHIDMLMYTDGLTTFSVFIDSATTSVPEGVAQRGATLAVMDKLIINNQPMRVTVVGEVPVVTAQKIAQNIKPL